MTLSISTTVTTFTSTPKTAVVLPLAERRKNRRFALTHEASVICKDLAGPPVQAFTVNASVAGLLLSADSAIPEQWPVAVSIRLQKDGMDMVRLHGTGRVVRCEAAPSGRMAIAVSLEKPMTTA